ncbi:MAG: hypothetical protein ACO3UU_16400, partial [Minisyncoccia bacterium]
MLLKVIENGKEPTRGSRFSAGIDLYSRVTVELRQLQTEVIPLGVMIDNEYVYKVCKEMGISRYDFVSQFYILLEPRSSLRAKGVIAGSGIVDMDYNGEIKLIVHNLNERLVINEGDKIAQIILLEHQSDLLGVKT